MCTIEHDNREEILPKLNMNASPNDDQLLLCIVCHDEDNSERLLRGACSCREANCHFDCLVKYAKTKTTVIDSGQFNYVTIGDAW